MPHDVDESDPYAMETLFTERRAVSRFMLPFFCTLLAPEALAKFGLLDESYESGLGVDDLWCERVSDNGWGTFLALDAFACHLHSESFRRLGINRAKLQREAKAQLRKEKHAR